MADYLVTDTELVSIADAIRTKGGTSAALTFPDGFVSAVQNIPSGADVNTYAFHFPNFDYERGMDSVSTESLSTYGLAPEDIIPNNNRIVLVSLSGTGTGSIYYTDSNDDDDWTISNVNWATIRSDIVGVANPQFEYMYAQGLCYVRTGQRQIWLDIGIEQGDGVAGTSRDKLYFTTTSGYYVDAPAGYDAKMYNPRSYNGNFTVIMMIINT